MSKRLFRLTAASMFLTAFLAWPAAAGVIYNAIPSPLPSNVASLGYQATQTAEFGDLIEFAGTSRDLTHVAIVLSDWAVASDYPLDPQSQTPAWAHAITLNLYSVDTTGANPQPGSLIATRTGTFAIPWRPETSGGCVGGWLGTDNACHGGIAFTLSFDFTGTTVPDRIIYGVAFNSGTWGYNPLGPGPWESLNMGLTDAAPSVGSNPYPGTAYWNTGTGGTFVRDTGWTPWSGAVAFDAEAPEPGTWLLLGAGLLAIILRNSVLKSARLRPVKVERLTRVSIPRTQRLSIPQFQRLSTPRCQRLSSRID